MNKKYWWLIIFIITSLFMVAVGLNRGSYGFASTVIILVAIILLYRWARQVTADARQLSLVAVLAALAALGRVPFAAIPGVQPTTFLVLISGFVFGPQAGFMVGATAALVSNFFLGQGPWTPWQMLGWGMVGVTAAFLARLRPRISALEMAIFGVWWGYLFGIIQDTGFWLTFVYPLTWQTFLTAVAASFAFDTAHAAGNFLLCLLLTSRVILILREYQARSRITYLSAENNPAGQVLPQKESQ